MHCYNNIGSVQQPGAGFGIRPSLSQCLLNMADFIPFCRFFLEINVSDNKAFNCQRSELVGPLLLLKRIILLEYAELYVEFAANFGSRSATEGQTFGHLCSYFYLKCNSYTK